MMSTLTDPRIDYRTLIARAIRILNSRGVMHKSGHVSARDAGDPNTMWINSRKASRSTLTAADVVPVDLRNGERIGEGDEPPSEFHIHRAIFNRRPEVGAIVHSHPEHIVALSIARRPLLPVTVDGAFLGARTPLYDDAGHVDTPELGDAVADALGGANAVVLRGHGVVVIAGNVEHVVTRIILAEENARMQYLAEALGEVHPLGADELDRIAAHTASPKSIRKAWHYEEETARRRGDLDGC
jgi:ribulose-5-phosphate 4-epimerase/fuculose-1-phosphate aldolase